ncbi:hypothetical protein [Acaryochloris thomasi]|uniref:hypothetical protein n=1 Tax=Acaryochloris thomasi TaxID=2929456 RepID=UPI001314B3CE|nr:hypothetical protein [Acaryochloris thomasi]
MAKVILSWDGFPLGADVIRFAIAEGRLETIAEVAVHGRWTPEAWALRVGN